MQFKKKGMTLHELCAVYVGLDENEQRLSNDDWLHFLAWPPNAFAILAAILNETGAYIELVSPKSDDCKISEIYRCGYNGKSSEYLGSEWRAKIAQCEPKIGLIFDPNSNKTIRELVLSAENLPSDVRFLLCAVFCESNFDKTIVSLAKETDFSSKVLFLLSIADETSAGFGVDRSDSVIDQEHAILIVMVDLLMHHNNRRSLATISTSRVTILPKSLTSNVGISLHSLSHHLSFINGEVTAYWNDFPLSTSAQHQNFEGGKLPLNILIIPYPYQVDSEQFSIANSSVHKPSKAGYFNYEPKPNIEYLIKVTKKLLEKCLSSNHPADVIVFPEATFTRKHLDEYLFHLSKLIVALDLQSCPLLIAGVIDTISNESQNSSEENGSFKEKNCSILIAPPRYLDKDGIDAEVKLQDFGYEQVKHHRWQLDHDQISTYDLGKELGTGQKNILWEGIALECRRIMFNQIGNWFSLCTLICEDLARQEPVSSAIRAVGPNLIVALLFDGPQKNFRWPARHATSLTEEPGSSVLTVTALGMSKRSNPKSPRIDDVEETNRTVALWRDRYHGQQELALEKNSHAIMLCLDTVYDEQISADCRSDDGTAVFLTFDNYFSIQASGME